MKNEIKYTDTKIEERSKMIQTLLLLTESDLKYLIIVLVYAGVFCVSLLQIIIRKERRRYNGSNRRGKRFGKSI